MNEYDETFKELTIYSLQRSIEDLEAWSVHNDDIELDGIQTIKTLISQIEEKI